MLIYNTYYILFFATYVVDCIAAYILFSHFCLIYYSIL